MKDILSGLRSANMDRRVPEGYFGDLQERLSVIPGSHPAGRRSSMRTILPAMAGIAAAIVAAAFVFTRTHDAAGEDEFCMLSYEEYAIADLIPRTDPYIYFSDDIKQTERFTDEDVAEYIEYLIEN